MVDLGKSPLCESFLPADRLETMEPFYPLHVRVCTRVLARAATVVRPAGGDLRGVRLLLRVSRTRGSSTLVRTSDMISARLGLTSESLVVELASNDGYLLQHFLPKGVPVLGVDPAANVARAAEERGVPTLVEFFGVELAERLAREGRRADLVLGNNVLAQVPDINDFVGGVSRPPRAGRYRDVRVPSSRASARGAPVRHDLPRALLVLLPHVDLRDLRGARPSGRRRRRAAEPRRLAARLRGTRQRRPASRRPPSRSSSHARRARGCVTPSVTAASRRTSRSRSARCSTS